MKTSLKTYCADVWRRCTVLVSATATRFHIGYANMSLHRNFVFAQSSTTYGMSSSLCSVRLAIHRARYGFERCL